MTTECSQCGREFKGIGNHWQMSSQCDYPPLTQKQREVAVGFMMGDGCIDKKDENNPSIQTKMITNKYLEHIDKIFGILGTGVRLMLTAEESAQRNRDNGFRPDAQAENYSDVYGWRSRNHPEFEEFVEWYSEGKKVWPENIELTPTVLKHWYCGDGHWNNSSSHNRIQISMSNELENTGKVDKMF